MLALPKRQWRASLALDFAVRSQVTRIVRNEHYGPLRVLKPFYPEGGCCHAYLIHPPGGLVLGDELNIGINALEDSHALITTPSAGKVYSVAGATEVQQQQVQLNVQTNACVEWLPQETLVFNGANAQLTTTAQLSEQAQLALWDVVCLGRPASQLAFNSGRCLQNLRIYRQGIPLLIERNVVVGGSDLQHSPWGLNNCNSFGTFIMTTLSTREQREQWLEYLKNTFPGGLHQWGLTQKGELLIARYRGNSASCCRQGFEWLWAQMRQNMCGKKAVAPRIWAT